MKAKMAKMMNAKPAEDGEKSRIELMVKAPEFHPTAKDMSADTDRKETTPMEEKKEAEEGEWAV